MGLQITDAGNVRYFTGHGKGVVTITLTPQRDKLPDDAVVVSQTEEEAVIIINFEDGRVEDANIDTSRIREDAALRQERAKAAEAARKKA